MCVQLYTYLPIFSLTIFFLYLRYSSRIIFLLLEIHAILACSLKKDLLIINSILFTCKLLFFFLTHKNSLAGYINSLHTQKIFSIIVWAAVLLEISVVSTTHEKIICDFFKYQVWFFVCFYLNMLQLFHCKISNHGLLFIYSSSINKDFHFI